MDAFLYRMKAAQRDLIERCGGIARAESITGFSKSHVGRWNNPNDPDLMPVGAVRALEADCGQPLITSVMAEANGRRLTDPDLERQADVSIMTTHAETMLQAAELARTMAVVISDGHVSPSEATTVDRVAASLETALSDLRASLAQIKARGGGDASLRIVSER
ncbi:hypothetical protein [Rhizobium sp. RU36D]|uniref:hypothetical protein n=1 Tax=Rhizobium sp. RU36D TaxID=1907415 RepID=UPI0009D8D7F4|nr:hypothetical protein [Rhizobium sp. RU36D]SMD18228.1 hypothetical protein SAMN05880593_13443 [Rhizobium sp. RU36D]